jgi:CRP-like cAMP-binding protein
VLGKIDEAAMNKMIDFLKAMPHFKGWTKNALSKLSYFFQKMTYLRNQVVFKEGEICKYVFIVYKGEFEVIKKMRPEQERDKELNLFLGPKDIKEGAENKSEKPQFSVNK